MSGVNPDLQVLLKRLDTHEASRKAMAEVLETLTPRERGVVLGLFGLFNRKMQTLDELAWNYSVTRERIAQIRQKALRKLLWHTRYPRLVEAEKLIAAPNETA